MGFAKCKEKRRLNRYTSILASTLNVHLSTTPTKNLAICNGGLSNGLSQEWILNFFSITNEITNIIMPHGMSMSFVVFKTVDSCRLALESVPEDGLKWDTGGPAFFTYTTNVPEMSDLYDTYSSPPGLIILENFVTEEEEQCFLDCIAMDENVSTLKHRTVKHFGMEFSYSDNRAATRPDIEPIPHDFGVLWPRLQNEARIEFIPDQCTVNRYFPGQGIPPHVDTHSAFTEVIACLSLTSDVVMDWNKGSLHKQVLIPRRSLTLFTAEARYGWTHAIKSRKSDVVPVSGTGSLTLVHRSVRTSVTFRRSRNGSCVDCPFPALCDTFTPSQSCAVDQELAAKLERTSVHQVYEEIADHFCMTRHKPWPNVVKFLNSFSTGDVILDVGCGNGKYIGLRQDVAVVGLDRSASLLQLAAKKYPAWPLLMQADCLQLPVRDNSVDGAISIAVLHHLSTEERRLQGIQEITRVLRPGGRALIYVWARNQESDSTKSSYLKQRRRADSSETAGEREIEGVRLPVHTNRTNFSSADMLVPWKEKTSGTTFLRYYHVFEESELKSLCAVVTDVVCTDCYYDEGNWCVILSKK